MHGKKGNSVPGEHKTYTYYYNFKSYAHGNKIKVS